MSIARITELLETIAQDVATSTEYLRQINEREKAATKIASVSSSISSSPSSSPSSSVSPSPS